MPTQDVDTFYKELGNLIKIERTKKGISQEILSTQLNLGRASIINLEKGRHRPSIYQLIIISEILQIDFQNLIPHTSSTSKKTKSELLNNIDNAISDQDSIDKTTKTVVFNFLSSIKKH